MAAHNSYSINVIDDGTGKFTAEIQRGPTTKASGGTALASGTGNFDFTVATPYLGDILSRAKARISDDASINGLP